MTIENQQKRIIHILLKEYNISDETYRDLLYKKFNVFSCTDLTYNEAEELIHYLKYTNDINYKCGYDKGIEKGLYIFDIDISDKKAIIARIILQREHRALTEYEENMINLLDEKQKEELIKNLIYLS